MISDLRSKGFSVKSCCQMNSCLQKGFKKLSLLLSVALPQLAYSYDVFGDLLYWKASEETFLVWANTVSAIPPDIEVLEGENLSFNWDLGFRIGVGHTFACDCWNMQLYWTHFQTNGKSSVPLGKGIVESNFFGGFLSEDFANGASFRGSLEYNMLDWQAGRNFCISECLSIKPIIGLKGGWIDQSFKSDWENFTLMPVSVFSSSENLTNDFWGIGPTAGAHTIWSFGRFLCLFGDFQGSFLWGTWDLTDEYKNTNSIVINTNIKQLHLGSLAFRAFVGICFEKEVSNCVYFRAQFGYESQIWFNQLRMATFQLLPLHGDLTLQGGTLNVSIEF